MYNVIQPQKNNEILPSTTRMDPEVTTLSEINQIENDKYCVCSHLHVNLKNIIQNKQNEAQRTDWWLPEAGVRVKRYKLPVMKKISHGDVVYSMITIVNNNITYLKVAESSDLRSSHHKKKISVSMHGDGC